jgi:phosphopantothenoylcysteine decarboxylase/phosphopantothenate--cysteine ligase
MPDDSPTVDPFQGREIIIAVCGGIAAYKIADVVSKLVQRGAGVTVVMTRDAQRFVTPLTFQALSGRPVLVDAYDLIDSADPQHIGLTERASLMLVAPATANIIGKVASGLCDDLVSLMIVAAGCPVVFAPAMNNRMWANPIVQANSTKLCEAGYRFIGPDSGWLACRNIGPGRLADPARIVDELAGLLVQQHATENRPIRKVE